MRVVIAVVRGLFRDGLIGLLREEGHEVVGVARDRFEAVELCHRLRPDLVLLDIDPPELRGVEAARLIKAQSPEIKVVFLTSAGAAAAELIETLLHGIEGYVLKEMLEDELAATLRTIANGAEPLAPWRQVRPVAATVEQRKEAQ